MDNYKKAFNITPVSYKRSEAKITQ